MSMNGFFNFYSSSSSSHSKLCSKCGLKETCHSPDMPPTGKGKKGILVIAEAPGAVEDKKGIQLIGKAGKLFRSFLEGFNIDLDRDCRKTNAITCRPPHNRTPTQKEITCCRPRMTKELKTFHPHLVLLLGGIAIKSYWGHRKRGPSGVNQLRGITVPDRENNCWVAHLFHPSFLLREGEYSPSWILFEDDLKKALSYLSKPYPGNVSNDEDFVKRLDSRRAKKLIAKLCNGKKRTVAFDYETTGLKPHRQGHKVISMAIAVSSNASYAFLVTKDIHDDIRQFLTCSNIRKIAANIKFEETWSRVFFGVPVYGWLWDTMICAHVLDNRPKITSVKFQAFIRFGVIDYDSHIKPFLDSREKSANAFNQIEKANKQELLLYNGLDALYEYRIAKKQMREIK